MSGLDELYYISFNRYSEFSYNVINELIKEGQNMWKLLKYSTPDALDKEDLTLEEKVDLIYKGESDSSDFRVFRIPMLDDASTSQICKMHIFPWKVDPYQRTNANLTFMIQIVCHNKLGTLEDGRSRCDVLLEEVAKILNGSHIEGIGRLEFNNAGGRPDYLQQTTWNNFSYFGYEFAISTGIA